MSDIHTPEITALDTLATTIVPDKIASHTVQMNTTASIIVESNFDAQYEQYQEYIETDETIPESEEVVVPMPVPVLRNFTYRARDDINPSDVTTLQEDFTSQVEEAAEEVADVPEAEADVTEMETTQAFITPLTHAYITSMLEPYVTALSATNDVASIRQWFPMILQEPYLEEIVTMTNNIVDVEEMKASFILYLTTKLIELAHLQTYADMLPILPWDVARIQDPLFTKLFGEPSLVIPVQVTAGPSIFVHMLSQDITFGLLSVLCKDVTYSFKISGVELDITHLLSRYEPKDDVQHLYAATLLTGKAEFDSPETIQGVKTAAQWLNIDSRTLVKDLMQLADNTALQF